eukprot:CAMPEP_0184863342 /NCGR_PEP_ID=MMETSP0580-20130426/10546_1 /TAXON_ID=1118495 /ORGANISM="Dactyliosolen fragilissimus" /LENGTH=442 /DNA_ID=CAMNT_0027361619 /DNA_START=15 /DNA_END=1343 /DNA_ORIENTATION=+
MTMYTLAVTLLPSSLLAIRPCLAFVPSSIQRGMNVMNYKKGRFYNLAMDMSSKSSSSLSTSTYQFWTKGISRLETLQTLLSKAGAPGSRDLTKRNDLIPISTEDVASLTDPQLLSLHPHLYPIARSSSDPSKFVCALRRAYADDAEYQSSTNAPWPIVEAKLNGFGYRLLALNSEHLMRRIAAEADTEDNVNVDIDNADADADIDIAENDNLIHIYNENLGNGQLPSAFRDLDTPYQKGSVASLGYGTQKFILLRVGPFPDLYKAMSAQHAAKNDQSSSLIAAEAANSKFVGFASSFANYAFTLQSFDNRVEEARDAARTCLRLPLPSAVLDEDEWKELAIVALVASETDNVEQAMTQMGLLYEKIRQSEKEQENSSQGTQASMTPEQLAVEEANYLLDRTALNLDRDWKDIRKKLGVIYSSAGMDDMASFVDPLNRYLSFD